MASLDTKNIAFLYVPGAAELPLTPRTFVKRVIAQLRAPLLCPEDNEPEGYVPSVVYTRGALIHEGWLILPYGLSEMAMTFATVGLTEVLEALGADELATV
jgi:predicted GH43/DUF377 family glycosyl hydrolase